MAHKNTADRYFTLDRDHSYNHNSTLQIRVRECGMSIEVSLEHGMGSIQHPKRGGHHTLDLVTYV